MSRENRFILCLLLTFVAVPWSFAAAEGNEYVEAKEAGYDPANTKMEPITIKYIQLPAKEAPKAGVSRITNADEWNAFLNTHANTQDATGKPLDWTPDFSENVLAVVFADNRGCRFSDVELYAINNTLKGYLFHKTGTPRDNVPVCDSYYVMAIPKKFSGMPIEARVGVQSWGRVCSRFSPAITDAPTGKEPTVPAAKN
jgi:hypothetical protein